MKKYLTFILAFSTGAALAQSAAVSGASAPYTPTWVARHYLQWLVDQHDLPVLTTQWPLPASAVAQTLSTLSSASAAADSTARMVVQNELSLVQDKGILKLQSRNHAEALVGFSDNYANGSSVSLKTAVWRAGSVDGVSFAGRLGVRAESNASAIPEQSNFSPEGSAAVLGFGGWNAQVFAHQFWWGPGWQSSLVNSNNSPAWQGVGLQRGTIKQSDSPWLAWMGPWNLDVFVAKAQDPVVVANQHQGFLFSGARLTIKPQPWLEMGFSRGMQSGGAGRPGGVSTFVKAFFGQQVNKDTFDNFQDSSGQIAGYDMRVRCPLSWGSCAAYTQWMGEDAAGNIPLPYKFMSLWGFENTYADGRYRVFAEYANTNAYSLPWDTKPTFPGYVNGVYQQGYTNGGRWAGASQGSGAAVTAFGWMDAANMQMAKLYVGRIGSSVGVYTPGVELPHGRMWGLSAEQTLDWHGIRWTPELAYMRFENGQSQGNSKNKELRIGLTASMPLFDSVRTASSGLFGVKDSHYSLWSDFSNSAGQVTDRVFSSSASSGWAWALGGVLAAHALDGQMNTWAVNHPNGVYKTMGKVGSNTPILLAGAVGLVGLGLADEESARLSGIAATSSVLALLANTSLKYAVGRARPELNLGDASFNHFNQQALNSSFASSHTAIAFALITPFAKAYDMPWLYGLGAMTAMGRVQERKHWLSDTVAGGAMGYAISSALMNARGTARTAGSALGEPEVFVAPNQIKVAWAIN